MNKYFLLGLAMIAVISLTACTNANTSNNDVISNTSASNQLNDDAMNNNNQNAEIYNVSLTDSKVEWRSQRALMNVKHHGTVAVKSGDLLVDNDMIVGGNFVIDMTTVDDQDLPEAMQANLEKHLMSADFFDVENYPNSTFKITKVEQVTTDQYNITGNLTIKAATKSITFPAQIEMADGAISAHAEFSVNRTDFDVRFGSGSFFDNLGEKIIDDMIEYVIDIKATK